jgi:DinB family
MSSAATPTPREQFLRAYEREHQTTMKVLRAFPAEKAELRPHHKCKTARELAWAFALERGLGTMAMNDAVAQGMAGGLPAAPQGWEQVLQAVEKAHGDFGDLIRAMADEKFLQPVKFMAGPGRFADFSRMEVAWMLLCDEIHHRGQFSIYLRMADGRVPSIYGPSADEPWY